jgi:ATP-binding cassette subfamily B (MDR/TAP) protein 1
MADKQLAFRAGASSFLHLARMNSLEWAYTLVGSLGSMVRGSFSAIFAPDPRYMKREIAKYCYLLIGMPSAALLFNTCSGTRSARTSRSVCE